MSSDQRIRNNRSFRTLMLVIGIVMVTIFYGVGIFMLVSPNTFTIEPGFLKIFAALLLIYGTYRGWRIYQDYF